MRRILRYLTPLIAVAGAAAAFGAAPAAIADTTLPSCTDTGGAQALGGSTTECETPGNVQINATQCETNGSSQIVTSPQQNGFYGGWPWWGGGGIVIGIGGWGW